MEANLNEFQNSSSTIHQIMTAYMASKALFLGVEFKLFDLLDNEELSIEQISEKIGLEKRPSRVLVKSCIGAGLVKEENKLYSNTLLSQKFLVTSSPTYMGQLAKHQNEHFKNFSKLSESLKTNKSITGRVGKRGYNNEGAEANEGSEGIKRFIQGLHGGAVAQAKLLADAVPLKESHLIDIGCGSAAYSIAFAERNSKIRVSGVDYPKVCEIAQQYINESGLGERVKLYSGDFFERDIPNGGDIVLLSHVIEGYGEKEVKNILEKVYSYLPLGGRLVLHSHLPERSTLPTPYLFNLIFMANTENGEVHGESKTRKWLIDAGFKVQTIKEISSVSSIIICEKN